MLLQVHVQLLDVSIDGLDLFLQLCSPESSDQ